MDFSQIEKVLIKKIKANKYILEGKSISRTDFGESTYFYVLNPNTNQSVKVRISDHSVTNLDRIFNEVHITTQSPLGMDLDRAWNEIQFKIDRDKKFKKVDAFRDVPVEYETSEKGLQNIIRLGENYQILSSRTGARGQMVYRIIKRKKEPILLYINKKTGLAISVKK